MMSGTKHITIVLLVTIILLPALSARAGWLVYHKPAFKGQLVDIDTKQPINGAIVVVVYMKHALGLGSGTISSILEIKEAVTGKDGAFAVPAYTTVIQPFSWEVPCIFIIYKPGYARIDDFGLENVLLGKVDKDLEMSPFWNRHLKIRYLTSRVVEIPKVTSKDERKWSIPSLPSYELLESQHKLIEIISQEDEFLGFEKSDPYKTRSLMHNRR